MNGIELIRNAQNPEAENYKQSEIVGGVSGLALGVIGDSVGANVFTIGGGLASVIASKGLQGEIDKTEVSRLINGLASFGKSLAAIGAANLILPGSGFFQVLLSALGLVVVGDTVYYVGKKTVGKVKTVLNNRKNPQPEALHGGDIPEETIEDNGEVLADGENKETTENQEDANNKETTDEKQKLIDEGYEIIDEYTDDEYNQLVKDSKKGDTYQFFGPVTIRV